MAKKSLTQLKKELASVEAQQAKLYKKLAPLQAQQMKLYEKHKSLKERIDTMALDSEEWDWKSAVKKMGDDRRNSMAFYRAFKNKVEDEFDMTNSGYFPETGEVCMEIRIAEKSVPSFEKNLKGVKHFASIMTPLKDGFICFKIFEKSLRRGGIYNLLVNPKNEECRLTKTTYGRDEVLQKFIGIEPAMKYIADKLPCTNYDLDDPNEDYNPCGDDEMY